MTSVAIHGKSAFKVPSPRKPVQSDCKATSEGDDNRRIPAEVDSITYGTKFLYLVQKLYTCPSALTGHELMLLRKHPVIGQLIDQAAMHNISIASFYIPVESILRPYASEKVQIYFREKIQIVINETHKTVDEDTEVSEQTAESVEQEPKIGFYTKKERLERIKKYKAKKRSHNTVQYVNKSNAAKARSRVKGKFVKASQTDLN
mmetsp:Transcript_11205/g.25019  ORF Transcript_11205/g.25019 Transcript_11205/m.25019 type:complete len:204 (-) Transcript_11205:43-654(-)